MVIAGGTTSPRRRHERTPDRMPRERRHKSDEESEVTGSSSDSHSLRYREHPQHERAVRRKPSRTIVMASKHRSRTVVSAASSKQKHRDRKHRSSSELKKRQSSSTKYVYKTAIREQKSSLQSISEDSKSRHEESESEVVLEEVKEEPKETEMVVVTVKKKGSRPSVRSSRHSSSRHHSRHGRSTVGKSSRSELRSDRVRSSSHRPRRSASADPAVEVVKRSSSTLEPREARPRSTLVKRSQSTGGAFLRGHQYSASSSVVTGNKRSSFFGFFSPSVPVIPEARLIECLTCLADDIPVEKSAKLPCGHRMCNSCLKRIFKLSVSDPQHMPPRCCTSDHIPLKHVDRLFDIDFKRTWNKKYQEYTTKNRIYCPARRCGEWIGPAQIKRDANGMKYGRCDRCKTKVCCQCSGRWHLSRECPKDEDTQRILETAKNEGWQRCYNCRAMVELKEGCNHMTCRCTAEFCMICGSKWKTCNCPWFNYEQVEADRLNHMRIPEPEHRRPRNYEEEIHGRRRQERHDERLARRLQGLAIREDDYYGRGVFGGVGDVVGIGNAQDHFLNDNFVMSPEVFSRPAEGANAVGDEFLRAQRDRMRLRQQGIYEDPVHIPLPVEVEVIPEPPLRRHTSLRERHTAPMERIVHRRLGSDYATEAARHDPRQHPERREKVRSSVMAGLPGRGSGRVDTWRVHVVDGEPEGGALNSVEGY